MQVLYDPKVVSYEDLLQVYWHQIDPTVKDRQFCDSGKQYRYGLSFPPPPHTLLSALTFSLSTHTLFARSAIFYHNEAQKEAAIASFEKYRDSNVFGTRKLYTEIKPAKDFWPAEEVRKTHTLEGREPGLSLSFFD